MPFLDYHLPDHLIAQHPAGRRDQSRLMLVRKGQTSPTHHVFADLPRLLAPGDLLVLNDTRVLPARLRGHRVQTGGKWEGLYLGPREVGVWEMLCRTRGRLRPGEWIAIDSPHAREDPASLRYLGRTEEGHALVSPEPPGDLLGVLARHGEIPLPPYIRKGHAADEDQERYQTVYARAPGSVAAPTAGLHFSPELFDALQRRGIATASLTLHVGLGTFEALPSEDLANVRLHAEWCALPAETVAAIDAARARGGRIVAVGTTATRTLETAARRMASDSRRLAAWSGTTDLFIHPPYEFRVVDALITNFHLPRTSLLLLVQALAGEATLRQAYEEAIARAYRFYSYGDAMLVL